MLSWPNFIKRFFRPSSQSHGLQNIDLDSLLYTTPTISNDVPDLETNSENPRGSDLDFHEDDWRRIEFLPSSSLETVKQMLSEYKAFEETHRVKVGWKKVFIRRLPPSISIPGPAALNRLTTTLDMAAKPRLFLSYSRGSSRVKDGFAIDLGGHVKIYGLANDLGISVLGCWVGQGADDSKLVAAFQRLSDEYQLILVDWIQQLVLTAKVGDKIEFWRPQ